MSIPVDRYTDPASLEEEFAKIFCRCSFVAHESDVADPDDYFSFRLGPQNLTLRRHGERLSLLDNVCRHRFNLIDPPGSGNRQFRCTYHGWTYRTSGEVSFVPLREEFADEPKPLRVFPHESLRGFVFNAPVGAARALTIAQLLDRIGTPEHRSFHQGILPHRCNWKLMVENVLEGYHLSVVHPGTFAKSGFTSTSRSEEIDGETDNLLSTYPHDKYAEHLLAAFPGIAPSYRHLYVFPNLFVSTTNDLIYFISNLFPIAANETVLHYRLFGTKQFEDLKTPVQEQLKADAIEFTDAALNEDKAILERCQIGIAGASGDYMLGAREKRIRRFHQAYMRCLDEITE